MRERQRAHHLAAVLRAEAAGQDLQEGPNGLHVLAMRADGSLYEIGYVSETFLHQDPRGARVAIEKIKFGRRRHA